VQAVYIVKVQFMQNSGGWTPPGRVDPPQFCAKIRQYALRNMPLPPRPQRDEGRGGLDVTSGLATGVPGDDQLAAGARDADVEQAQTLGRVVDARLVGGLTGCSAGFALTTWMSYDWPLLVGGKPIAALPPYVVKGLKIFGATALTIGIALILLIVYAEIFGYR